MPEADDREPSWEEAKTQWGRINERLLTDIPSLNAAKWQVIPSSGGLPPFGESPYAQFLRYLLALDDVCQQTVYAMQRLQLFTHREWSSPWELYVKYYLCDFLSRIKTATDLLALALNVVFDLGRRDEECSLEKGYIAGALTAFTDDGTASSTAARGVGATLNRQQNEWIKSFYGLRNLVIHRNGLRLGGGQHAETGESYVFMVAGGLLDVADDRKVVERVVTRLGLLDDPLTSTSAIEPVNMCEQLWERLAELVNSVLDQSMPQIERFVSDQRAAREGKRGLDDDGETAG